MPRVLPLLAALIILSVINDPYTPLRQVQSAPPAQGDRAVIHDLIGRYISCFNEREAGCILRLYADRARIRKEELTDDEWLGVDEYAGKLRAKLGEYEARGAYIDRYDIEDLDLNGKRAELSLAITAKQGSFSKDISGSFRLAETSQGWRIIRDDF